LNRRVQGRHCQRYAGDPSISNAEIKSEKQQLRKALRELRRSFSQTKQSEAARRAALHAQTLPQWPGASKIGLYLDADGELGTQTIISTALDQQKDIYLPVIGPENTLAFANWKTGQPLVPNRFGINEPDSSAPRCAIAELDILFMPLVAWDKRGNRLGMGAGYYDRALRGISGPSLIGLAHSEQEIDDVPSDDWDVVVEAVLTEQGVHHCQKEG